MIKVSTKLKRSQKGEFICLCRFDSCSACSFMVSVRKNVTQKKMTSKKKIIKQRKKRKKRKKWTPGWIWIDWYLSSKSYQFLIEKFDILQYPDWTWLFTGIYYTMWYTDILYFPFHSHSIGHLEILKQHRCRHSNIVFVLLFHAKRF